MSREARLRLPTVRLDQAEAAIEEAILRLLGSPLAGRPFLVVEDVVTDKFVQFAGSDGEDLLIDVPARKLSERFTGVPPADAAKRGASEAVQLLRSMGLPDEAELRLVEDETFSHGTRRMLH